MENHRQFVLARRPSAEEPPLAEHVRLVEGPLPEPGEGEVLIRTLALSLAPVMRHYMMGTVDIERRLEIGDVIHGRGVGEVIASNHPDYPVGTRLCGQLGWQTHKLSRITEAERFFTVTARDSPPEMALAALGITGFTAWIGLFDLGRPKPGETVLVSGAAGGVGSVVGPLAAAAGCRVVGLAGSDEKCRLLTEQLKYHAAINYREADLPAALATACPDGIDIYFDNVGGPILNQALARLARFARVVLCGRISEYVGADQTPSGPSNFRFINQRYATVTGFFVYNHPERFAAAEADMAARLRAGTLPTLIDALDGFEAMPAALRRLYDGANIGKQIVRVADPLHR